MRKYRRLPRRLFVGIGAVALTAATNVSPVTAHAAEPVVTAESTAKGSKFVTAGVTGSAMQVEWADHADATHYLLIDDRRGKVLWRGDGTSAQLPLHAPSSADVLLVKMTRNGGSALAEVLATQPPVQSGLTPLVAVTAESGTQASWGAIADVPEYEIGRGEVASSRAVLDRSRQPEAELPAGLGDSGVFTISGNPVEEDPQQPDLAKQYGVEVVPPSISVASIPNDADVGYTVVKAQPTQAQPRTTTEYQTYIPQRYVDAPENFTNIPCDGDLAGTNWVYSGDVRTDPEYNSNQYRTHVAHQADWNSQDTTTSKDVSPTSRYELTEDGRYIYDSTQQAGDDGIQPRVISNDGNYARNVIEHEGTNPYCDNIPDWGPIPSFVGISYSSQQDLYRNGGHYIYGSHDQMPNHQFYRVDVQPNGDRRVDLIFNHEFVDPTCLWSLLCGSRQY